METLSLKKGFSGSTLKLIAIITMFIDHIGAALLEPYLMAQWGGASRGPRCGGVGQRGEYGRVHSNEP